MKRVLTCATAGALAFWAPDLVAAIVFRKPFVELSPPRWLGLVFLTIIPVLCLACAFVLLRRLMRRTWVGATRTALYMVAGVWVFGPVLIMIALTIGTRDGGFHSVKSMADVLWILFFSVFPIYTFIMATYDGTLFALLLASILVPIIFMVESNWPVSAATGTSKSHPLS